MNILYYIPGISKEFGGVYQYALALLKTLTKDSTNSYYIYNVFCPNSDQDILQVIAGKRNFHLISAAECVRFNRVKYARDRVMSALSLRFPPRLALLSQDSYFEGLLAKLAIHTVHSPYQILPQASVPMICTMHDVQELHFPGYFTSAERERRAIAHRRSIEVSAKVVVSYQHVKNDIVRFFLKSEKDVHVILLDMENLWVDKFIGHPVPSGDRGKFLLYPAATWEHKNHLNLIKAISLLQSEGLFIKVVCTGNRTEHYSTISQVLGELKVEENFQFLGIVPDEKLYELYMRAYCVVIPSLYEAGSFPLIESILLGRPVICSNVTSLPETINSPDFTFDPRNTQDIARSIRLLWQDELFYARNREHIRERAGSVRRNNAFSRLMDLYSSIQAPNLSRKDG